MDQQFESYRQFYKNEQLYNSSKNNDFNSNQQFSYGLYEVIEQSNQNIENFDNTIQKGLKILNNTKNDERNNQNIQSQESKSKQCSNLPEFSDSENNECYSELEEVQQQFQYIGRIFCSNYTSVKLNFSPLLNKFIVTKQYLVQNDDEFEKERKILEKLKDKNITLDIITTQYQTSNTFQQIAGKTNLQLLKQKIDDKYLFQALYFNLLDKLNQMHELGIAHSDIKPQNIVISYDNEPFFIDFGGSISLLDDNEHQNYLNQFTPQYNLKIYFEIFIPSKKIYKTKQLTSKEKIKLCDRTQLSLTFLQLLCNNNYQLNLFYTKQYNELLQSLGLDYINETFAQYTFDDNMKWINGKAVLFNISKILNQADPTINIIGYQKEQLFLINQKYINQLLIDSNDIVFQENVYKVQHIDKFSILLIEFLDRTGQNLEIAPNDIYITQLPDIEQFKFISKKYKINEQFQNSQIVLSDCNVFNIIEYIKAYDQRKFQIQILNIENFIKFFMNLQNVKLKDTQELILDFDFEDKDLNRFIETLSKDGHNFQAKKFKNYIQKDSRISSRIIKDTNKDLKEVIVRVNIAFKQSIYKSKQMLKSIKTNYRIKKLEFYYRYSKHTKINFLKNLKEFNQLIDYEYTYQCFILYEGTDNQEENNNSSNGKGQLDTFIIDLLNFQVSELKQKPQKLIFKFVDCIFKNMEMWQQIKSIIENKNNFYFEIFAVNCKFSRQVAQILIDLKQDLNQKYRKAKYEFNDIYYQTKYKPEQQRYSKNIEHTSQSQLEKGLNVIFYEQRNFINSQKYLQCLDEKYQDKKNYFTQQKKCKLSMVDRMINREFLRYISLDEKDFNFCLSIDDSQEYQNLIDKYYQKKINDEYSIGNKILELQNEQKNINDTSENEKISNFFKQDQTFEFTDLKELKIQYEQQIHIQQFNQMNKQIKTCNMQDIDSIIKDIEINKNHYSKIKIFNRNSKFKFNAHRVFRFDICCESEDIETLTKFNQLCLTVSNYNNRFLYNRLFSNCIQINKQIKYPLYTIIQVQTSFMKRCMYQDMLQLLGQNVAQGDQGDYNISFPQLGYCIELNDMSLINGNQIDKIRDIFNYDNLEDNFNYFYQYFIKNSIFPTRFIFSKKEFFINILFKNYNIGDECFKIFLEVIEKSFLQNKMYTLGSNSLTVQTLHNIFNTFEIYQPKHKLYFQLIGNNMSYSEFKQFIHKYKQNYLINQFIFEIKNNTEEIETFLNNDFQDSFEIENNNDMFFIVQVKVIKPTQNKAKTIKIKLEFDVSYFQEQFYNVDGNMSNQFNQSSDQNVTKNDLIEQFKTDFCDLNDKIQNIQSKNQQKVELEIIQEKQEKKETENELINKTIEMKNDIRIFNQVLLDYQDLKEFIQNQNLMKIKVILR